MSQIEPNGIDMNCKIVSINIIEAEASVELSASDEQLLSQALKAAERAYTPYSNFKVGAAVRLGDGTVVTGNNQENAAYPSGLCAERTALFYALALHPHHIVEAIAITAMTNGAQTEEPIYPCGACRQVMLEAQKRSQQPVRVIMGGARKIQMVKDVTELLPLAFDKL